MKIILYILLFLPCVAYGDGFLWYPYEIDSDFHKSIMIGKSKKYESSIRSASEKFLMDVDDNVYVDKFRLATDKLITEGLTKASENIDNFQYTSFSQIYDFFGAPIKELNHKSLTDLYVPPQAIEELIKKYPAIDFGALKLFINGYYQGNSIFGSCYSQKDIRIGFCYHNYIFLNQKDIAAILNDLNRYASNFEKVEQNQSEYVITYLHELLLSHQNSTGLLVFYGAD
jgi:hypothetical protein